MHVAPYPRRAHAQSSQQLERRQRGGDRAVEQVPFKIPARPHGNSNCTRRRGYCPGVQPRTHGTGPLPGYLLTRTGRRSHCGTRNGMAHGADAQNTQQVEHRQRGGDRAVERVRAKIPARPPVRHGYSRSTCRRGHCRGYSPVPPGTGTTGTGGVPTATGCEDTCTAVQGYVRGSSQG
jgi:hypothetical protein